MDVATIIIIKIFFSGYLLYLMINLINVKCMF